MKLRIFSDLHIDVNNQILPEVPQDDTLNIICGDLSGDISVAVKWLKKNIKNGLFIRGNHDGLYSSKAKDTFYHSLCDEYEENFPITANVSYLDFSYKIINDIVFIGVPLWTDYKYGNGGKVEYNMRIATKYLNDFHWNCWEMDEETANALPLTPETYLELHQESLIFLRETLTKFKDKKCVLITHHCMSPKCIDRKHKNSRLNASFVSDLEELVLRYPNIALICSGHTHTSKDFCIGNTRYIINALGYFGENPKYNNNLVVEV